MKTLQEFTIVFEHDEMISALAAALTNTKILLEEEEDEQDDLAGDR